MNGGRTGGAGLACSILILALLGGVLALTAGHDSGRPSAPVASEAAPPADEPPESLSSREITRIAVAATPTVAHRVEKIRGLKFDHIPKPEVVSADYLNHLGVKEGGGLSGIGVGEAEGRMTGLLKPNEELENAYGSTGDLAAAAYDPETERLYIVRDTTGVPNRALIEYLLSHELDHALEDQNFGIGGGGKLDTDASLARQAMIEGLATSVMQDYATDYLNPIDLLAGASGIDTGNHGVPQFLVDELTWTYLGGQDWIDALRDVGQGWKLVDYALGSRPPVSTEQILHPIKYLAEETPDEVEIDDTELRDSDLNLADRAGLGERQTQDLLKVGASDSLAELAAAGWNGDSYELWREPGTKLRDCADPCRTGLVLIIRWSWDSKKGPGEFDRAARAYIGGGLGGKPVAPGVWSLGPTAVATGSAGNTSALVFAPDEAQARRLVNAQLQGSAP